MFPPTVVTFVPIPLRPLEIQSINKTTQDGIKTRLGQTQNAITTGVNRQAQGPNRRARGGVATRRLGVDGLASSHAPTLSIISARAKVYPLCKTDPDGTSRMTDFAAAQFHCETSPAGYHAAMARWKHLRCGTVWGAVGVSLLFGAARWAMAETPALHNTWAQNSEAATSSEQEHNALRADGDDVPALKTRMPMWVDNVPIKKFLDDLAKNATLNLDVRWNDLEGAGIDPNTPVTVHLPTGATVATILNILCKDQKPGTMFWVVKDGVVVLATPERLQAAEFQVVRWYDIHDLIVQNVNSATGMSPQDEIHGIIALLTGSVAPDTWRDAGGTIGSLQELNGILIINQTPENHRQIAESLAKMRSIIAKRRK
jgi:hypothetical protein